MTRSRPEIALVTVVTCCATAYGRMRSTKLHGSYQMLIEPIEAGASSERRTEAPDSRLHDFLAGVAQLAAAARQQGVELTPETARQSLAAMTSAYVAAPQEALAVQDTVLSDATPIPLRIYDPAPGQPLRVCLYLHGGGHMAGSIDVYDPICRKLALASQALVVSVDYPLAPEHPYPEALDAVVQVIMHLQTRLRELGYQTQDDLTVAGDSAGGALTASVSALSLLQPDLHITRQILIYPSLDYTLSQPSVKENATGYILETEKIQWYFDRYLPVQVDRHDASPLFMGAGGLPATLVFSAGFCPLRDEAYAYVAQLREAEVQVAHWNLPAQVHAFLNLEQFVPDACAAVYQRMAEFIQS